MDQSTLIKIARLRTLSARKGKAFDVVRFAGDRAFAQETLARVMDTDDEDILLLGLELMQSLGMVQLDAPPPPRPVAVAPVVKPVPKAPAEPEQRYVGRLR